MPNSVDIYTPRTLAEVARQTPPISTFFRDTFFRRQKLYPTARVDIDLVKGDRHMAPFVSPRLGGVPQTELGYQTKSYAAPLLNPVTLTTADQLMDRRPGEELSSGRTPAQRAAEKLMEEYRVLNDQLTRREEWMAARAILDGKIVVRGVGVDDEIDFLLTNQVSLSGTAQWGKSAAAILDNLEDWVEQVLAEGFANADMLILGKSALRAFLADEKVLSVLDNRRIEMGLIHPRDLPNGVRYIGHLNKPDLDIYQDREVFLDDWTDPAVPAVKPLVDDNKAVVISSGADFLMAYGQCSYIDDATRDWVTAETDRLLRSYIKHGPDRRFLEAQARPLPIPDKVDSWLVATVC